MTLADIDPLYVILGLLAVAIGIVVYLRASHERRIKQTVAAKYERTEKVAERATDRVPPLVASAALATDKAGRIKENERLLAAGIITQAEFDTAKIRIAFE